MFKYTIALILAIGFLHFAEAKPDKSGSLILSVAGVVNDRVSEIQNNREDYELNFGGGALIEAGINDNFGIEVGALLINRQYDIKFGSLRVVQEARRLHIPILARFWVTDFLSAAAGPFFAFKTGRIKTSIEIGDSEIGSIKTSADNEVEYGLDSALTLNFAVNDKSGVFIEGRYSAVFGKEQNEEASQASALAGFKIDM